MCLQQQHKQKTFANPSKNIAEKKKEQKTKGKTIAKLIALAQTQKEKLKFSTLMCLNVTKKTVFNTTEIRWNQQNSINGYNFSWLI